MNLITDRQITWNGGPFPSQYDTVKVFEGGRKFYKHGDETFATKSALRRALSSEYGCAWIEEKDGKKRYFIDESGWLKRSIKEVSKEEFVQKLGAPSTWQKVLGIGLGVLALAPGAIEFARHIPKETGLGLLALQQKGLLLGAVGYSCLPCSADAQAMGTEFQVNTYTTSDQQRPSVAPLNDGGFVVSWMSWIQDGSGEGIFGQRYTASGAQAGTEFQVNTYMTSDQQFPRVAPLYDGGFVVSWQSTGQDGLVEGIYGQRFNVTGAPAGTEFQVNTYTTSNQQFPSIAPLNDGGFVVSWQSDGQDGSGMGIFGQRYNATGARTGSEFQVNTYTANSQQIPSIAPLNDGGFVVIWTSSGQDGSSHSIYGQRYTASGLRAGTEFQVNTYLTNSQLYPSVAPLNDGGFVVTWTSSGQDGELTGIFGQRYDTSGALTGNEFQVNTYTTSLQWYPSVAPLNDGGFVVTWQSFGQDGNGIGIFGQRYDSNGNPVGLTVQTPSSDLPSQMGTSAFLSNLPPSSSQIISVSSPNLAPNGTFLTSSGIIYSVIDIVYEESYPIYVNGQTVGTYTISGGTGLLNSGNPNVITMHFNPNFAPEEEEVFIPLFSIPPGQATDWQSIQLGDTDFECLEAIAEINPSTSGDTEFGLIFTGADFCTASGSQIIAGILPIMMN